MNTDKNNPAKAAETSGQEIEKTHESYEKGYPAPGTRHAGEEGAEQVAHQHEDYQKNTTKDKENKEDKRSDEEPEDRSVLGFGR